MKNNIYYASCISIAFFLVSCSDLGTPKAKDYLKEANDFCYAHSIEYWEKNGLLEKLNASGPAEKQKMFVDEFSSKITSEKMNEIVYEQTGNMTSSESYSHFQKHISALTKTPFDCQALRDFYNLHDDGRKNISYDRKNGVSNFSTVVEAFEALGVYVTENGTIKVLSDDPFHIQLSPSTVEGDSPEVIKGLVSSTLVYGIYRAYVHSPIQHITVTAIPLELDLKTRNQRYLPDYTKTLSISRDEALSVVKKHISIGSFADLILKTNGIPDQWIKEFDWLIYSDEKSNVNSFVQELEKESAKN